MATKVECAKHGPQEATYVCSHLADSLKSSIPLGFYYASEPRGDAWCRACEAVRIAEGGESGDWNDRSEAFAKIKLLCGLCYDKIKRLNVT